MAEEALIAGAEAINDITAFADPEMLKLAVSSGCGVCAMHMQGTPQTMQDNPQYEDVVVEVLQFLRQRRDALAGRRHRACADRPGSGHRFWQDQGAQHCIVIERLAVSLP